MDKNRIILTTIASMLSSGYEYKPNQLKAMLGDKYESYIKSFDDVDNQEFEKELIKLFNEYLSMI